MVEKHECCHCGKMKVCSEHKDVVGGDDWNWWCKECLMLMRPYSKDEKSLIMFFETCLVDGYGRIDSRHMNDEDFDIAIDLQKRGLIEFGRLKFEFVEKFRGVGGKIYTHWVRFSDIAWKLVHTFRRERADRILERNKERLEKEMTKNK